MGGEVRRRKNKKHAHEKPPEKPSGAASLEEAADDVTLWNTFSRHPLVRVGFVILAPFSLYWGYYYMRLRKPHWVSSATLGVVTLRPAVSRSDERQVLIVGPMSSGTVQTAKELSSLGLEVGHENSNADWSFVRDGTVSWMHGLRFLPRPSTNHKMGKSLQSLCANFTDNMGFHPSMFWSPSRSCSFREKWSACWRQECIEVVLQEWGCAKAGSCTTPYRRTLHQARNPLRTIESLVSKFCQGGLEGNVHPSFLKFASALFPERDFSDDNCIEAAAEFVLQYNNALLAAGRDGLIDGIYKIEESSPCDVAHLAGFMSEDSTIYKPNYHQVIAACDSDAASNERHPREVMESTEHRVNIDLVTLGWSDLRGGVHASKQKIENAEIERKVKKLFGELSYNADLEPV